MERTDFGETHLILRGEGCSTLALFAVDLGDTVMSWIDAYDTVASEEFAVQLKFDGQVEAWSSGRSADQAQRLAWWLGSKTLCCEGFGIFFCSLSFFFLFLF